MQKKKFFYIAGVNLLVFGLLLLPVAIPLGLAQFSVVRALMQLNRGGIVDLSDNTLFNSIRRLGRYIYMEVPLRSIVQYSPECFELDSKYIYLPRSNSSCIQSNIEFDNSISFGRFGDRMYEQVPQAMTQKIKKNIVILGDSHAMGWGVSDADIFTSHLHREGVHSVNLSVSSYGTYRQIERLADFKLKYPDKFDDFDAVVIQYCDNDIGENLAALSGQNVVNPSAEKIDAFVSAMSKTNKAHLANKRSNLLFAFTSPIVAGKTIEAFKEFFLGSIRFKLKSLAHRPTAQFHQEQEHDLDTPNHADAFFQILKMNEDLIKNKQVIVFISNAWGSQNQEISRQFASHPDANNSYSNVALIEPFQGMPKNYGYYYLDDHLNAAGHKVVANSISKKLLSGETADSVR